MEIFVVGIILLLLFNYLGTFNFNKFVDDNRAVFDKLKEDDYDFLLISKYGENIDLKERYQSRVKTAIVTFIIAFLVALTSIKNVNMAIKLVAVFGITYLMFKDDYSKVKRYYKAHLHDINLKLPYYLKSLEILIQHYTVPVAIGKSMADAPGIFKDGLQDLINAINSGDDTIKPYMEFAKLYPVRDSMRMMRLLYRLSIGRQDRKQEQLLAFSRTISNLQQKARETKYKNRLEKMQGMTMKMLVSTGIGVMILLILAVLQMIDL